MRIKILLMIVMLASVAGNLSAQQNAHSSGGSEPADNFVVVDNIAGISLINNPDSATITYYRAFDKETSLEAEGMNSGVSDFSRSILLSEKEYRRLYGYLKFGKDGACPVSTYRDAYALLGHADINIRCYKDGQIVTDIYISSLTSNITIYAGEMVLKKQITNAMKSYLTKVLRKHGLWSKEMKFNNME